MIKAVPFLSSLLRIDAFRTLHAAGASYCEHPHLQQLLDRFATYNGSSPFRAPATLSLIAHIELSEGAWYVSGGMYTIARVLEDTARAVGVVIRYGEVVRRIRTEARRARGVVMADGRILPADIVVCNADTLVAEETLFDEPDRRLQRRIRRAGVSLSGFVLLLGIRGEYPVLRHHNVFFSKDYREEFETLFAEGMPHDDPTVYVAFSGRTDTHHAPPGHSNLFVLVNAPPVDGRFDWDLHAASYRLRVLETLERQGLTGLQGRIVVERTITPTQFARRYNAYQGSLYGMSSNSRFSAFLRPPNRSRRYNNVYYAGGSTHPGGGIPLVLLSGKKVAELIGKADA